MIEIRATGAPIVLRGGFPYYRLMLHARNELTRAAGGEPEGVHDQPLSVPAQDQQLVLSILLKDLKIISRKFTA